MKRTLSAVSVALCALLAADAAVAQSTPAAVPPPADTTAWLTDLARLRDALGRQYPNLEWAVERRGVKLSELSRSTEAALRTARSDVAARSAIEAFINAFGDGHLEVRWPAAGASSAAPSAAEQRARPLCDRLGYQRARRGGGVRFDLLPGYRWIASADSVYFRAGVMVAGKERIGILRIASFEDNIHPELCEEAARNLGVAPDADCEAECGDRIARGTSDLLTAALERRVAALQAEGITRLLVDVTSNGGGSNWIEAAARTLTPVPLRGARVGFIRHPHYVRSFDAAIERLARDSSTAAGAARDRITRGLATLRRQRAAAAVECDRSALWEDMVPACSLVVADPPRYSTGVLPYLSKGQLDTTAAGRTLFYPSRYRYREGMYRGPLAVLVDPGTVSAAEYFAALMMDNRAGIVMGAPTFGAGCEYTNGGIRFVLPNSGGRVLIPDCTRYRADGTNEVEGVEPEIMVPWRSSDTPMQRARRVIETLPRGR